MVHFKQTMSRVVAEVRGVRKLGVRKSRVRSGPLGCAIWVRGQKGWARVRDQGARFGCARFGRVREKARVHWISVCVRDWVR